MKKKLLLIAPQSYIVDYASAKNKLFSKKGAMLNAGLAVIAALTPSDFEVKIIDENVEPIDFDAHYDMVGLTGFPTQFFRARQIAHEFQKRGVLVVCGGSSVSVSPEKWGTFADILIVGEAERIWPEFMADYLAGSYKNEYRELEKIDLTNAPVPDYSSISPESLSHYMMGIVQTGRGCPYNCEFCDVIVYVGRKMRYKPVETVLKEVDQLYNMGIKIIILADDNFSAGRKNAKSILRALRDWNRKLKEPVSFVTQLSIDIAKDDEFLELAVEAGLRTVLVGIETPNVESLKEAGKLQNLETDIVEDVKRFHEHGIVVGCGCVVGFDNDDLSIFQKQFDFLSKIGITRAVVSPLQAPDGTPLKERMIKEGRYVEWENACTKELERANTLNTFTVIPKQMTVKQLQQGALWLIWKLYNPINYAKRVKIFFDNYENSPKKDKLNILKPRLGKEGFGLLWRIFRYYITKATPDEKTALKLMFGYARKSSLPHRYSVVLYNFLLIKGTQEAAIDEEPGIANIKYPVADEAVSA